MTIVIACILMALIAVYGLARSHRWTGRSPLPPSQLPTVLQRQELDRRAFQHRIRTRVVLDSALHRIQEVANEHRDDR